MPPHHNTEVQIHKQGRNIRTKIAIWETEILGDSQEEEATVDHPE